MPESTRGTARSPSGIARNSEWFGRRHPHETAAIHLFAGIWLLALGAGLAWYGNRWGWPLVGVAALHIWLAYHWEMSTKKER